MIDSDVLFYPCLVMSHFTGWLSCPWGWGLGPACSDAHHVYTVHRPQPVGGGVAAAWLSVLAGLDLISSVDSSFIIEPLCLALMWYVMLTFCAALYEHKWHLYGLCPKCVAMMWLSRFGFLPVLKAHKWHRYGFSLVCLALMCSLRSLNFTHLRAHMWHR